MFKRLSAAVAAGLVATLVIPSLTAYADDDGGAQPSLLGRAVLPVETYAPGPPSGTLAFPPGTVVNGITFPLPSQPVQGLSAIVAGRQPGEFLAMPDNGFGGKANSKDFLIRAYYISPDFKTATGGSGAVHVDLNGFIQFRDPHGVIGFEIVNEATNERLLTGGDIDPESLQRGANGDLWVGDEFGPWVLHFDATGVLLDPPFAAPGGLQSPNNPHLAGATPSQPNSRGFEAMAISPDGNYLYPALEGATVAEAGTTGTTRRHIFQFSVRDEAFTGREWIYQTTNAGYFVSDMAALDRHHLVVIERDGGRGLDALFRKVYRINLNARGSLAKIEVVNLAAVPDPDLVSLPALHDGDVGLGNPYRVTCESIEAIHQIADNRLLLGCDNNFPNTGRNPSRADDNEFIVVDVPELPGE